MGVKGLLQQLPGGNTYLHDLYKLALEDKEVPIDAASLLWQCAAKHASDYLAGNHMPALIEFAHHLNFLRSICRWKIRLYFDGTNNPNKRFEDERREQRRENANSDYSQIKNTPAYLAKAARIAKSLSIKYFISKEEADPHVSYEAMTKALIPVTGDSDLIAYGVDTKIVIVHSWQQGWYRIIDLQTPTEKGEYPLYDLYNDKGGKVVFQIYAACLGCDFTEQKCGIKGIGFEKFKSIAYAVEGQLNAESFSHAMWNNEATRAIAIQNGMNTAAEVKAYLQGVVDIFCNAEIYDDKSNTISMTGVKINEATVATKEHMEGSVNTNTMEPHPSELIEELNRLESIQLLHQTAANKSNIRGAQLPEGKTTVECNVGELRDIVAARNGNVTLNKPQLIPLVNKYLFLEQHSRSSLVDRNPNPNGLAYANLNTSGQRNLRLMLQDALEAASRAAEDKDTYNLIEETCKLYDNGHFDDKYDNIADTAPELPEGLIYKEYAHIGSSVDSKSIGDALKRCLYSNDALYHALAFVPGTNRVIILSKAQASMKLDETTRKKTAEYEPPKKQQYLVILELTYRETNDVQHKHALGIFTEVVRSYCGGCIAGQGSCRHKAERLWHQYHHWTDGRLGVNRPPTLSACSWAPGGRKLASEFHLKIHQLQTVKLENNIEAQKQKLQRNHQTNSTAGRSHGHVIHLGDRKQNPNSKLQFSTNRPCVKAFFESLRK